MLSKMYKKITGVTHLEEKIQKQEKLSKSMYAQIELMQDRLKKEKDIKNQLEKELAQVTEQFNFLNERYQRTEALWERAIEDMSINERIAEKALLGNAKMANNLLSSLDNGCFSVLSAFKVDMKPFDCTTWEILYVESGALGKVQIKRYNHETLANIMFALQSAMGVSDIHNCSLVPSIEDVM